MLLVLLGAGCRAPLPDRHLQTIIGPEDIIGVWSLSPASLAFLIRDGFDASATASYQIAFATDGELVFQSVLAEFRGGLFVDVEGTWTLRHNTDIKNQLQLVLALPARRHELTLNVGTQDGHLVLWDFYGDPDEWEFLTYQRAATDDDHARTSRPTNH